MIDILQSISTNYKIRNPIMDHEIHLYHLKIGKSWTYFTKQTNL